MRFLVLVEFTRNLEDDLDVLNIRRYEEKHASLLSSQFFQEIKDFNHSLVSPIRAVGLYFPLTADDNGRLVKSKNEYIIHAVFDTCAEGVNEFVKELQGYYDVYGVAGTFNVLGISENIKKWNNSSS